MVSSRSPSLSTTFLFLSALSLLLATPTTSSPFSKIYAFGDSFTDTGNTQSASGPIAFGYVSNPPYGATFFRRPTNRYSDGRLVIDFLADALSLPFLPPYLNRTADSSHGINFAVAGSTALDHGFFVRNNISYDITPESLGTQLQWFDRYLGEKGCRAPAAGTTSPECRAAVDGALFWVGEIGVNDYAYTMGSSLTPEAIRDLAIKNVAAFLEALLRRGAKHMVVQGQPMIGCLPMTMTLYPQDARDDVGCSATANHQSDAYNALLLGKIQELRRRYPGAVVAYADYFGAHHAVMRDPKAHGFAEPFRACCGAGGGPYNFDFLATCGSPEVRSACKDPWRFVNWDGVHLTEAMYKAVADLFFRGAYCRPAFQGLLGSKVRG